MDLAKIAQQSSDTVSSDIFPVLIRCYSAIGRITALGKINVEAQQIISNGNISACSVRVEVEGAGDYPQSGVALIEYDNIDRVCATLDQMKGADPNATKFAFMEAICEVGDFKIVVFNTADRRIFFSVQTGSAQVHMELAKLPQLIDLLRRAKDFIDKNKAVPEGAL